MVNTLTKSKEKIEDDFLSKENKELENEINKGKKINKKKLDQILQQIEKEESQLVKKCYNKLAGLVPLIRTKISLDQDEKVEEDKNIINNKVEVDINQFSVYHKTKNILIKILGCIIPFSSHQNIIKIRHNSTIMIAFRIYRFTILLSIFSFIIFIWECIVHIMKKRKEKTISVLCKFYIPCFLQYSSFGEDEKKNFSLTYGIWLIIFTIASLGYYFILGSENYELETYFRNNKSVIPTAFLTTSWNFNYKKENICSLSKKTLYNELQMYANNFLDEYDDQRKYSIIFILLSNVIYLVFLCVYFIMFFLIFLVRDILRNKNQISSGMKIMDILADIISYLLLVIILYLFSFLTDFFPAFEGWHHDAYKKISHSIKKMITTIIGIFSLIFIFNYYTLHGNNLNETIKLFGTMNPSFFGCPGKYEDHRHTYHNYENILDTDYKKMKSTSYAQCREEDVGNNFFIIFLFYFLVNFIIELFKNCFNCCRNNKENFNPVESMIKFFTAYTLYCIAMFYIPFLSVLFPLIVIALYRFQYYLLKKRGTYTFTDIGIIRKNGTKSILLIYLTFAIGLICIQSYLYLLSFPHFYKVECYTPKSGVSGPSILLYETERNWCGPFNSYERASKYFSDLFEDIPGVRWVVLVCKEMPFLIVVLAVSFIMMIYRKDGPDEEYFDFINKKQRDLERDFRKYYDQIEKREMINKLLIKMAKDNE